MMPEESRIFQSRLLDCLRLSRLSRELLSGSLSHDLLLSVHLDQYYVRESSQEVKSSQVSVLHSADPFLI